MGGYRWSCATSIALSTLIMLACSSVSLSPLFAAAWTYLGPADLPSLVKESNAIVMAEIVELTTNYTGLDSGGDTYYAGTVFLTRTIQHVKGSGPQSVYVVDAPFPSGDSMVSVGKRYVLFVSNDWRCAPSPPSPPCALPPTPLEISYLIVGGPQGKFLVVDGRVYGYKSLFPDQDSFLPIDANGVPLDDFLAQIRNTRFVHELLPGILVSAGLISTGIVLVVLSLTRRKFGEARTEVKPDVTTT